MASARTFSNTSHEIYREILQHNLPKIVAYFKSIGTYEPQKLAEINNRISEIQNQQRFLKEKMKDTERKYHTFVFDNENSDINPLRGDNGLVTYYTEIYNNAFVKERTLEQQLQRIYNDPLWINSKIITLLAQVVEKQSKFLEVQETVAWQQSEAYKSISRYERDDDESEENYDSLLSQYKEQFDLKCEECLKYKEIIAYINMIIAENNKQKIQNAKNNRRIK